MNQRTLLAIIFLLLIMLVGTIAYYELRDDNRVEVPGYNPDEFAGGGINVATAQKLFNDYYAEKDSLNDIPNGFRVNNEGCYQMIKLLINNYGKGMDATEFYFGKHGTESVLMAVGIDSTGKEMIADPAGTNEIMLIKTVDCSAGIPNQGLCPKICAPNSQITGDR